MKRKLNQPLVSRKLRSTLPRRRRQEISPIFFSNTVNEVKSSESIRRIVTRLYSKKREKQVSESSCVDSSSVLTSVEKNETSTAEFTGKTKKVEPEDERGSGIAVTGEGESGKAAVSESSCVESCSNKKNELSTAEFVPEIEVADLVCSEKLLCDEDEEEDDYSSAYSDLGSDVFGRSLSENYTPSVWIDSGSEFSEKSFEESSPSPTFSLFIQFSHQFCPSAFSKASKSLPNIQNDYTGVGMEDEEDEMSYRMLRSRERRQVYMHDYAEEYCSDTDYGHLVIQQRLQMVHWLVEVSSPLQTLF